MNYAFTKLLLLQTLLLIVKFTLGNPINNIVGGADAPLGAYPHQVSLRKNNSHFCGGSIVNKRCVLTAAHCIKGKDPEVITVHVGTNFLNESGQVRKVKSMEYHSGFNLFFLSNDVGVIILQESFEFSETVRPIKLSTKNIIAADVPAILSGWGRTIVGGNLPNALQHINLKVISRQSCKADQWRITESHICTLTKSGEGACHGDSGGPLISNGEQIGLVSFGTPCAKGKPDVFTRISTFYNWIDERCSN